jgi:hypothetical protein
MGLTCSLLGHAYGDPETEREREERGEEVVDVTREVRECDRCGDRTVVSENTEVRSVRSGPEEEVTETTADSPTGTEETADSPTGTEETADLGGSEPGPDLDPGPDPATDEGVILDDDGGPQPAGERAPGEWPSAADTRFEDPPADSPGDADATEPAPDPAEEDAEVLGRSAGPEGGATGGTNGPAATDGTDPETAAGAEGAPEGGDGAGSAAGETRPDVDPQSGEPVADVTGRAWPDDGGRESDDPPAGDPGSGTGIAATEVEEATDGAETVFVCPACEFREATEGSSLRSGDICPECREGYLAERTRN